MTNEDLEIIRAIIPQQEIAMLEVLASSIVGRDTNTLIAGLVRLSVLSAILSGVESESFAKGVKASWDFYADAMNAAHLEASSPTGSA